jgi:hypothetical protein
MLLKAEQISSAYYFGACCLCAMLFGVVLEVLSEFYSVNNVRIIALLKVCCKCLVKQGGPGSF